MPRTVETAPTGTMLTAEQIAKRMTYDPEFAIGENVRGMMAAHIAHAIKAEREACAKVAEAKAQDYLSPEYATGQPFSSHAERFACKQVAEAIRARTT